MHRRLRIDLRTADAADVFYNNLKQIVQTPDTVMILTEMVHDARIIRIGGEHLPRHIRKWMGDSVGHWEGDTLVVDTTNFTDKTRFRGSSDALHIVERLTRVDAKTLRYQFTIEDPTTWTKPWTAEYSWPATNDLMYDGPRAMRVTTRWATSCAARASRNRTRRRKRSSSDRGRQRSAAALDVLRLPAGAGGRHGEQADSAWTPGPPALEAHRSR